MINELLVSRLLLSLTPRRIKNILQAYSSFFLSAFLKKPVVWGLPPVLTVEPTNQCNLHCPLCTTGSGAMLRKQGHMSLETFQQILNLMGDDIFFMLIYHQGEPYLNKNFFDFVRLAKRKRIYVTTSTNGHYFTDTNIDKTLTCGLDSMIVSLDGTTQESYARYRVGGKMERVITGTRKLIRERKKRKQRTPNVALQFLVMQHNESELTAIGKLAKEMDADRLLIKNIEVHSLEEAKQWLPKNENMCRYRYDGNSLSVKGAQKESCPRPWASALINWDGTVVPCCFDKNGLYPMGSINKLSRIKTLWLGQAYSSFRKKLLENRKSIDICRNCNQGFGSFLPSRLWFKGK